MPLYTSMLTEMITIIIPGQVNKYGPKPSLDSCNTDESRLESISSRWGTMPSATYARKMADGALKRCSAMVISPGDFVDVTATVDIVSVRKGLGGKTIDVHFAFTRVVRLLPNQELLNVSSPSLIQ